MKQKNIKKIIMEHFFLHPSSKLRVREIERKLRLPLPSVIRYCRELEKEDILAIENIGSVNFYTASRSRKYLLEKKLFNIRQIYDSGLIEYLRVDFSNPAVVLFGSFARGEDVEESDIDIFIETASRKEMKLERFKKKLFREIQIFKNKRLSDISNPHLKNNIVNGITLNNQIEVFM